MPALVLVCCGLFATLYGTWRGYLAARGALVPLIRDGEPTRTRIEATRPFHSRTRVRVALRQVVIALLWLSIALYGMYLVTVGTAVRG